MFKRNKTKRSGSGKVMASLSKLSKAFMLPIALLPIAGLFLGIGSTWMTQSLDESTMWWWGKTLKTIGNIPFENLPALFAISIAIAYTNNAGAAGLTAFLAWLVFNAFIAVFMKSGHTVWNITTDFTLNWKRYPNWGSQHLSVSDSIFKDYSFTMEDTGTIPPWDTNPTTQGGFVETSLGMKDALANDLSARLGTHVVASDLSLFNPTNISRHVQDYNLFFWKDDIAVNPSIVTPILGIGADTTGAGKFGGSLNTGVFGGIIVGATVAYLYNKFYRTKLPKVIAFFGGVRSVPILAFLTMPIIGLLTIFIWPGLGILFNDFGKWTGTLPFGVDSFVFGLAKRALLPFGLHHVFYAPLWWSGAGGSLSDFVGAADVKNAATLTAHGDQSMFMAILNDGKLKIQDVWSHGLHVGRFMSGEFAMMMFALPAIAIAMWLTIPKENRRAAMGIYFGAAITSMLTGITEPLEFTFLFVVPLLYYLIHVPIFASAYMLANVTGIRVGMTFSGGMLDWIIFGIIPTNAGHITNWWLVLIEGPCYGVFEALLFYFLIKFFKWKMPGYEGAGAKLFTKSDVRNKGKGSSGVSERTLNIIEGLGGVENLENVDACATRLRVSVKDSKKVDSNILRAMGAVAVVINGKATQSIFGGEADNIKQDIIEYQEGLKNASLNKVLAKGSA